MRRKRELRAQGPQRHDVVLVEERDERSNQVNWRESGRVLHVVRKDGARARDEQGRWKVRRTDGAQGKKVVHVTFVAASEVATVWKEVS